jgi:hypothetical protein
MARFAAARAGKASTVAPPDAFGRYRVIRHLGSGSFATVWLAHDDRLDTPVAVKVLAENWTHHLDVRHRFLEEARILRQADSAWLIRVHDIGTLPDDRPYFVMPFADQGSVADLIAQGPPALDEALRLLTEIGQGVTVLHRHGTIHRDIKPSNVLLQSSPVGQRVLVADLGFAKRIDGASGFTAAAGTPGYMSPEQSTSAGDIDVRADVYALGAVAYELITGRHPPRPPVRVPPGRLRPGVPAALDDLVMSALAVDRADRPPDAKAFTDRIRSIRMTPALRRGAPWWARGRPARRRAAAGTAALLALLLAATGAAGRPGTALVEVRDEPGGVHLAVPRAWAHEVRNGWSEPAAGGRPVVGPGLLVATDADAWTDPRAPVAGVFVAPLPEGADPAALAPAPACPGGRLERRALSGAGGDGLLWRWSGCPRSRSVTAAVLERGGAALYVEIRQPVPRPELADRVLGGVRPV